MIHSAHATSTARTPTQIRGVGLISLVDGALSRAEGPLGPLGSLGPPDSCMRGVPAPSHHYHQVHALYYEGPDGASALASQAAGLVDQTTRSGHATAAKGFHGRRGSAIHSESYAILGSDLLSHHFNKIIERHIYYLI